MPGRYFAKSTAAILLAIHAYDPPFNYNARRYNQQLALNRILHTMLLVMRGLKQLAYFTRAVYWSILTSLLHATVVQYATSVVQVVTRPFPPTVTVYLTENRMCRETTNAEMPLRRAWWKDAVEWGWDGPAQSGGGGMDDRPASRV